MLHVDSHASQSVWPEIQFDFDADPRGDSKFKFSSRFLSVLRYLSLAQDPASRSIGSGEISKVS